jgi:two-component system NarL family sensor kinase
MSLVRSGRQLVLTVADDGAGFDPEGVAVHPQHGIGLRNMIERMDAIGGTLTIASSAQGTTVWAGVELAGEGA